RKCRRLPATQGSGSGRAMLRAQACAVVVVAFGACSPGLVAEPGARCVATRTVTALSVAPHEGLDLLFVIDDSPWMAPALARLQQQLPALVGFLITGELDGQKLTDAKDDLDIGVVSATLADGRALHHVPAPGGDACASEYPEFLRYRGPYFGRERDD